MRKIQVFRVNQDGTFDFTDTIVVDENDIPEGYAIPDKTKEYKFDGTEVTYEELLLRAKKEKLQEIYDKCDEAINGSFVSTIVEPNSGMPYEFYYNEKAQMKFNGQTNKINLWLNKLSLGEITQADFDAKFPISWNTKNFGWVQFNYQDFSQILDDAENHERNQYVKRTQLEMEIETAYQNNDINAINAVIW